MKGKRTERSCIVFERKLYFGFEAHIDVEDIALNDDNSENLCRFERELYFDFEVNVDIEYIDVAVDNSHNPYHFGLSQCERGEMISLTFGRNHYFSYYLSSDIESWCCSCC